LIFGFMIILGVVGNVWLVAGGALGLVVIGVTWLMIRRRAGKKNERRKRCHQGLSLSNAAKIILFYGTA
jgi:hypothetical protein